MMKKLVLIVLFTIFVAVTFAQRTCTSDFKAVMFSSSFNQCDNNSWHLVFEDNFESNNLDLSVWELQPWAEGELYGNGGNSQEYNSLDNVKVSNGTMKIIAKREHLFVRAISYKPDNEILEDGLPNKRDYYYTSSNIWTKRDFGYGRLEAKIKIPKGKGFWPAFWMFGANPWEEIDVFEFWNESTLTGSFDPSKLSRVHNMTVHDDWDNDGRPSSCGTKYSGVDFSEEFHIYTIIWEKDMIQWLVDGVVRRTDTRYYDISGAQSSCTLKGYHQYLKNLIYPKNPMSIILNLSIQSGGDKYNNAPDSSTPFPSEMEVDWVRFYKKSDPCEIVEIQNEEEFLLSEKEYNLLSGFNVSITGSFIVYQGEQLDIKASNSIILSAGFEVKEEADFKAEIIPELCMVEKRGGEAFLKDGSDDLKVDIPKLNVYPNPSNGRFSLDLGDLDYYDYSLILYDLLGKEIYSLEDINTKIVRINIPNQNKGHIVLKLISKSGEDEFIQRIVVE